MSDRDIVQNNFTDENVSDMDESHTIPRIETNFDRNKQKEYENDTNRKNEIDLKMNDIFDMVSAFTALDIPLEPIMKYFIPDYIAASGDNDAFLKIPRPDQKADLLGLEVLDEPCGQQSDPAMITKNSNVSTMASKRVGDSDSKEGCKN
ncbi:hypothetical protein ROZALSC1DRAFT_27912 [Rozella allomycis CSF55]|uniref:Intraflagellar transport complex B protein 46 domain-containing protein n=1 Tax=Rozella allomycis (strain CSF55) TaxID=988480 RepID=A0A075AVT6_ROZAC|nr:Intraflagellar transport complex B protein 46 domain-containing protein [Rozella allomycis CSF55]RKP20618.1 hypothetical protein ROZALSC1DRAFT_27912 [Rozella allomycis CSF55]|eukprot:EPZ34438.1 Intraflagellar transport complex B protein 46 domain-containing protein [Rozella allomycis CSF55]